MDDWPMIFYTSDMKEKGRAYIDEELFCEMEGCPGNQYIVEWEDGDTTVVCGRGIRWISDHEGIIL